MYAHRLTSEATNASAEPVSVSQVKNHLRITAAAEDALIGLYITAARQMAEDITKRALINTQWELTFDSFDPTYKIVLPRPPLSTDSAQVVITYTKTTGDTTTINSTVYAVEHRDEPGFIRLNYNSTWPDDVQDTEGAVRVVYRSGYTTANQAPEAIKHWIKMRAGQMYEYREPIISGGIRGVVSEVPRDYVDGLLDPYRVAITI